MPFLGQVKRDVFTKKTVRQLYKNARAIAGIGVGPRSAAMRETLENLECVADNRVRPNAMDVGDKSGSAGIMLKLRAP